MNIADYTTSKSITHGRVHFVDICANCHLFADAYFTAKRFAEPSAIPCAVPMGVETEVPRAFVGVGQSQGIRPHRRESGSIGRR